MAAGVALLEFLQGDIQSFPIGVVRGDGDINVLEINFFEPSPAFLGVFLTGMIDQNLAHGHVNRSRTLNDFVTPVVELAGDRLHAEAMRRGLVE